MAEDGNVNFVLGKALSVLPETELIEPVRNLLHRRPSTDLTLSVLDRHVGEFTNTRQDRVVVLAVGALQALFDHLVGAGEQRGRNGNSKRFGCLVARLYSVTSLAAL